jgi:hypothetical protein
MPTSFGGAFPPLCASERVSQSSRRLHLHRSCRPHRHQSSNGVALSSSSSCRGSLSSSASHRVFVVIILIVSELAVVILIALYRRVRCDDQVACIVPSRLLPSVLVPSAGEGCAEPYNGFVAIMSRGSPLPFSTPCPRWTPRPRWTARACWTPCDRQIHPSR